MNATSTARFEDYRFEIRPLTAEDGGGYLVSFPDLPGCMSDGESYEDAISNARDAFDSWVAACIDNGREIPSPNAAAKPAKFVLRLPRSQHERLAAAAAADGVSLNTFTTMLIAEGLARRELPGVVDARFRIEAETAGALVSWPNESMQAQRGLACTSAAPGSQVVSIREKRKTA